MKSAADKKYDYAIIGAGAAGLQLCLAMLEDPFFQQKSIAIIERNNLPYPNKTWCYWETGTGNIEHYIHRIIIRLCCLQGKVILAGLYYPPVH